jgi:hypothetical protein
LILPIPSPSPSLLSSLSPPLPLFPHRQLPIAIFLPFTSLPECLSAAAPLPPSSPLLLTPTIILSLPCSLIHPLTNLVVALSHRHRCPTTCWKSRVLPAKLSARATSTSSTSTSLHEAGAREVKGRPTAFRLARQGNTATFALASRPLPTPPQTSQSTSRPRAVTQWLRARQRMLGVAAEEQERQQEVDSALWGTKTSCGPSTQSS